jgi:ribosomal protein L17
MKKKKGRGSYYYKSLYAREVVDLHAKGSISTTKAKAKKIAVLMRKTYGGSVRTYPLKKRRGDGSSMMKIVWSEQKHENKINKAQ